jgi:hypothetical protein
MGNETGSGQEIINPDPLLRSMPQVEGPKKGPEKMTWEELQSKNYYQAKIITRL